MHIQNFRISATEKLALESKAAKLSMTLSQYIRYKLLDEIADDNLNASMKWLDNHYPVIMRLIVSSYLKISAISEKTLSSQTLDEIGKMAVAEHKKLGIKKEV